MTKKNACPCNSGQTYFHCCKPLLAGDKRAETAEALMRSRYSAYALNDVNYLLETWHPSTRPAEVSPDTTLKWQDLNIVRVEAGGKDEDLGIVEFKARYLLKEKSRILHEISRFTRENDQWFYINGDIIESSSIVNQKVGRNTPCPCGSGKKFKKCCGQ